MGEYDDLLGRGEYAEPTRAELESELATLRVRDEHYEILLADNLALRAELDNLRNRVNALADEWEPKFPVAGTLIGGELPAYERLRAIVRGSDDETPIRADLTYGDERGDQ